MIGGEPNSIHTAILDVLNEPGSKTKGRVISAVNDQFGYSEKTVKAHLADLINEGYVVEHPDIDGAWIPSDDKGL